MQYNSIKMAAKELNRRYIGCDICKDYVDIANKRLSQETLLNLEAFK
jgi:DNA modification methylase